MYQSLYRRYRPRTFEDVVGQDGIVEVLKNQIKNNNVGHAYLFTGIRGTGKTSIAKILAQAINCENRDGASPCNKCKSCLSILSGNNPDVTEIDAASNNGVDDIRLIKDEISFLPTTSKYRIYIIDEVHMLSTGASNALLKTLEEPPAHVKFILATTEPQKLPATVLSRCQRFEFTRIDKEIIYNRLKKISSENNIDITDDALKLVSILAKGSMRDGISILESISNSSEKIDANKVRNIVGLPNTKEMTKIFENMIKGNTKETLYLVNNVFKDGKEPQNFMTELLRVINACYLNDENILIEFSLEDKEKLSKYTKLDKIELYKIIKNMIEIIQEMKYIEDQKILIISSIINICEKNKVNKYLIKSLKETGLNIEINEELKRQYNDTPEKEIQAKEEKNENNKKHEIISETLNKLDNKKEDKINISEKNVNKFNNNKQEEKEEVKKEKEQEKNQLQAKEKEEKNQEENKIRKIKKVDTLEFRKQLLNMGNTPIFVALNSAEIIIEGDKLVVDLSNESNRNNLKILNNNKALEDISKVGKILYGKEYKVEYTFEKL